MGGGAPDLETRLDRIEKRQRRILRRLNRLYQGIAWFLDAPPPKEPRKEEPAVTSPRATPERLFELRPTVYAKGWEAFHAGIPRDACPYATTRGGYRNAWLLGWDDAESGLDRRPAPSDR